MDLTEYLFKNTSTDKKQKKIYNLFCELEDHKKYNNIILKTDDRNIADVIHNNYDNMTTDEMRYIICKCLTDNGLRHILLKYEMFNYKGEPKKLNLKIFTKKATKMLSRFHFKAGGFGFRDNWIVHDESSKHMEVHKNEVVFENTITNENLNSSETMEYMKNVICIMTRLSLLVKVSVHSKFSDRDKIHRIFIKCVEMDLGNTK